jgi:hypothetical protein
LPEGRFSQALPMSQCRPPLKATEKELWLCLRAQRLLICISVAKVALDGPNRHVRGDCAPPPPPLDSPIDAPMCLLPDATSPSPILLVVFCVSCACFIFFIEQV